MSFSLLLLLLCLSWNTLLNSRLLLYDYYLLSHSFRLKFALSFALSLCVSNLIIFYMVFRSADSEKRVKSVAANHERACQVMQKKLNNKSPITAITTLTILCNLLICEREINEFRRPKIIGHSINLYTKEFWHFHTRLPNGLSRFIQNHKMQINSCSGIVSAKVFV